jgi:nucleoside-diphosphate-sugar epimerase
MKRYLITGAQGFVGRYLVSHILKTQSDAEIHGIGRSKKQDRSFTHLVQWAGQRVRAPLPPELKQLDDRRYRYTAISIHQRDYVALLIKMLKPDVIIHLASGLRDDPLPSLLKTNVEGTIDLLEAIVDAKHEAHRIILGSTGGVYGAGQLPLLEESACNPVDFYSSTKLAAEHVSRIVARRHSLPVVWARLFNLAGPGQDERHICGRFSSNVAAIAEGLAPAVLDVESLDTTRDFIDVRDVASGLVAICNSGEPAAIYNVGSGHETTMRCVLDMTLEAAGLLNRVTIRQKTIRSIDIPRHVSSIERLRGLGFECCHALGETIADTVEYYRIHVRATAATKADMVHAL